MMHARFKWTLRVVHFFQQFDPYNLKNGGVKHFWHTKCCNAKFAVSTLDLDSASWLFVVPQGWVKHREKNISVYNFRWQIEQLHLNLCLWHSMTSACRGGSRRCVNLWSFHFYPSKVSTGDAHWADVIHAKSFNLISKLDPTTPPLPLSSPVSKFAVCRPEGFTSLDSSEKSTLQCRCMRFYVMHCL